MLRSLALLVLLAGCQRSVVDIERDATAFGMSLPAAGGFHVMCLRPRPATVYASCTVFPADGPPVAIDCEANLGRRGCRLASVFGRAK